MTSSTQEGQQQMVGDPARLLNATKAKTTNQTTNREPIHLKVPTKQEN